MMITPEKAWEEFSVKIKSFILRHVPEEESAEDILQFSWVGTPLGGKNPGSFLSYCV